MLDETAAGIGSIRGRLALVGDLSFINVAAHGGL
jgi:hypothetical protein